MATRKKTAKAEEQAEHQEGAKSGQSNGAPAAAPEVAPPWKPTQTVLVLQGGGALGAYHAGVYHALHEAGLEPTWIIGTSIGAINGALVAGNPLETRLERLQEFWERVSQQAIGDERWTPQALVDMFSKMSTVTQGVNGFYKPNPAAMMGIRTEVGIDRASYYSTAPLRNTLLELLDFDYLNAKHTRLTVGAVNARTGEMKYFDSRQIPLGPEHVMASGALPPGFPAIRVDGEPYWDGAIYSNTPIEVVLDDNPRRDSLIFSANVWQPHGSEPQSLWQVLTREEEIVYSSRAKSHIRRQEQIHRLRHIIRELAAMLPEGQRIDPQIKELTAYGCRTTMHLVNVLAPRLDNEDHTKAIDFSRGGVKARWQAGYHQTKRVIGEEPWQGEFDPLRGVIVHESVEY
jgi:NTE family protein